MKRIIVLILIVLAQNLVAQKNAVILDKVQSYLKANNTFLAKKEIDKIRPSEISSVRYWKLYSTINVRNSMHTKAFACLDSALLLEPNNGEIYLEIAVLNIDLYYDADKALIAINKAISLQKNPEFYFYRGIYNQMLNKNTEAIKDYKFVLNSGHKENGLFRNYALVLTDVEQYQLADSIISLGLIEKPNVSKLHMIRGDIAIGLFQIDSTIAHYKRAISLNYRGNQLKRMNAIINDHSNFNIGNLLIAMQKFSLAKQYFIRSINTNENHKDVYFNTAYCAGILNDYKTAEKYYLLAKKNGYSNTKLLYNNLALLYEQMGEYEKEIEMLNLQIAVSPEDPNPIIHRGRAYLELKMFEKCENDYNQALKMQPEYHRAYAYLAHLQLETKRYQEALNNALLAIEAKPDYGFGHVKLGMAKAVLNMDGYCNDFQNAIKYNAKEGLKFYNYYCDQK